MAIDPSIPLQIRPMQQPDLLNQYGAIQGIQAAQQRQQLNDLAIQQHKKTLDEDAKVQAVAQKNGGDLDKTADELAAMGMIHKAREMKTMVLNDTKSKLANEMETLKVGKEKLDRVASLTRGIRTGEDFDAAMATAEKEKLLPPDQIVALRYKGWSSEMQQGLSVFQEQALTAQQAIDEKYKATDAQYKAADEAHKALTRPDQARKISADATAAETKAEQDTAQQWGSRLAAAKDLPTYAAVYKQASEAAPDIVGRFTPVEDWNEKTSPDEIRKAALTPSENLAAGDRESAAADRAQAREDSLNLRKDALDQGAYFKQSNLDLRNQMMAQQNNLPKGMRLHFQSEIDKSIHEEGQLNRLRTSLGTAIRKGNIYVDKNGQTKSMDSVARNDDEKESMRAEMRDRFVMTSEELKKVTERKNSYADQLGIEYSVPTSSVHEAIDKGTQQVLNPDAAKVDAPMPKAGKPTAQSAKPSAEKYTEAEVRAAAAAATPPKNGDAAVDAARKRGLLK